jgi:putative hydrolase of the HAD superfamily
MQAVLFDLDGTLLDRRDTFRRHLLLQVQRLSGLFGPIDASHIDRMLAIDNNGHSPRDEFYQQVASTLSLPPGASSQLLADFEAHFPETCVGLPNLHVTLERLQEVGLTLGLITNGRALIQGRKIDGLDIRRFLDVVVISEVAGVRKPDPRIFATALTQLGVDPANAAYVGDNPDVDVIGAKRSGLLAIWKRDNFWAEPSGADWIIDDLAELPPLVLTHRSSANLRS